MTLIEFLTVLIPPFIFCMIVALAPGATFALILEFCETTPLVGLNIFLGGAIVGIIDAFIASTCVLLNFNIGGFLKIVYPILCIIGMIVLAYIIYNNMNALKRSFVPSWSKAIPTDWSNHSIFRDKKDSGPSTVRGVSFWINLLNPFMLVVLTLMMITWDRQFMFTDLSNLIGCSVNSWQVYIASIIITSSIWNLCFLIVYGPLGYIIHYSHDAIGPKFKIYMTLVVTFILCLLFHDLLLRAIYGIDITKILQKAGHLAKEPKGILFQFCPVLDQIF